MAESLDVIGVDGKSNACLLGYKIFGELLCDTNTILRISSVWFNLVALLSYFVFFEMGCNLFMPNWISATTGGTVTISDGR
jgi:hypothetical protein